MRRKLISLAVLMLLLMSVPVPAVSYADSYADTPTVQADGLAVPKTIILLEQVDYYDYPNALTYKPAGTVEPRTVEVVEAERNWCVGRNWWKIKMDAGEKWIVTYPEQFEATPPAEMTLLEEYPVYASPNAKSKPVASISPQNVQVTGAEQGWFRKDASSRSPERWFKIQTWLGDRWLRLPLEKVIFVAETDASAFISYGAFYDDPFGQVAAVPFTEGQIVPVTGIVYGLGSDRYRVLTADGPKWVSYGATLLTPAAPGETLIRKTPTDLYPTPDATPESTPVKAKSQTFRIIETMKSYQWSPTWYHLQSDTADGWMNPDYTEPDELTLEHVKLKLQSPITYLYRYPGNSYLPLQYGQLAPQDVTPVASWTSPSGDKWYKISTYLGAAWIRPNYYLDTIIPLDQDLHMKIYDEGYAIGSYFQVDGSQIQSYHTTVGESADGKRSYYLLPLADVLPRMKGTGPDQNGWWTVTDESGYSFQVKPGESYANTLWQGVAVGKVKLTAPPVMSQLSGGRQEVTLVESDVEKLLGVVLTTENFGVSGEGVFLRKYEFLLEALKTPVIGKNNRFNLIIHYYMATNEKHEEAVPELALYEVGADGAVKREIKGDSQLLYSLTYNMDLHAMTAAMESRAGSKGIRAVIRAGERLLWQQDFPLSTIE